MSATTATITLDANEGGRDVAGDRFIRRGTISLNTYATGGIAVAKGDFDFWVSLAELRVDPVSGYTFVWDKTNAKVLAYTPAAHTHDLLLKNADVVDGATTRVNAGANLLGANTGASVTVTGQIAGASAHGGVLGIAAGAQTEVANATDLSAVIARFRAEGK